VHCLFLPWQYYYSCALSLPFCPALCSCPPRTTVYSLFRILLRPPKPSIWDATAKKQKKNWHHWEHPTRRFTFGPPRTPAAARAAGAAVDWQMGNAGAVVAATVAGGAAEDGLGAAPATKGRKKGKTQTKHRPGNQRHRNKEQER